MTGRKWKWKAENNAQKKEKRRLKAARDDFRAPFVWGVGMSRAASNEGRSTWNKRQSQKRSRRGAKC